MYLVTWEDAEGMWLDDPSGWNSLLEALACADKFPPRKGACVGIYRCDLLKMIEEPSGDVGQPSKP